jgi:hypothetical protein
MQTTLIKSPPLRRLALAAIAALSAVPQLSHAIDSVSDPVGDFLPTFGGSALSTDLDVTGATVTYNPATDVFTLSGTFAGAPGSTSTGFYVWGVNKGAGTPGFGVSLGLTGVLFDAVILLRPNGTGSVGAAQLPAGAVTVSGNTITGVVSGSLLPSTGFAKANYTFNLWPRDGAFGGIAAISDFAPNNANFSAVQLPVPEPASAMVLGLGLGLLVLRRSRVSEARRSRR